jgi:hypothetical protein
VDSGKDYIVRTLAKESAKKTLLGALENKRDRRLEDIEDQEPLKPPQSLFDVLHDISIKKESEFSWNELVNLMER